MSSFSREFSTAISIPETFYDQLGAEQPQDRMLAHRGLLRILDLPADNRGWFNISQTMIERSNTDQPETRPVPEIASRVLGLMGTYPWLQGFTRYELSGVPISSRDLDVWTGNHIFDDFPGLWGITVGESHALRATFNGYSDPEQFRPLCEELGVIYRHDTDERLLP